jgi:hypothetical protein
MEAREEELAQPEEAEALEAVVGAGDKAGEKTSESAEDKVALHFVAAVVVGASSDAAQDLEQLKQKLAALEETLKSEGTPSAAGGVANAQSAAEKEEDKRSIFVGNVRLSWNTSASLTRVRR